MRSASSIAVIGGGILGLATAYRLSQDGVHVDVFERSEELGGLAGSFDFHRRPADRFYHVVLPTDDRVLGLAGELGLGERFRFMPTRVGFYDHGRLFSMSSLGEFMRFPLLGSVDRLRLARFVLRCRRGGSVRELDREALPDWLRRTSGHRVYERLWEPLLDSKFGAAVDDLPATYLWARTRRMSGTRDRAGRESMGWLEGGYQTLVDALAAAIRRNGGRVFAGTPVERIVGSASGVSGLIVGGRFHPYDLVISTLLPPQTQQIASAELRLALPPDRLRYLGVVCLLLRTRSSVSPYHTLNITDRRIPLTTVVETTHVVDPVYAGGHLVYAAKYVGPNHPDLDRDPEIVGREYLAHLRVMFPHVAEEDILARVVQRARMVEPVHLLGGAQNLPSMFPVHGLALASTVHVYPEVVNGQAVLGVAERQVEGVRSRLTAPARNAA